MECLFRSPPSPFFSSSSSFSSSHSLFLLFILFLPPVSPPFSLAPLPLIPPIFLSFHPLLFLLLLLLLLFLLHFLLHLLHLLLHLLLFLVLHLLLLFLLPPFLLPSLPPSFFIYSSLFRLSRGPFRSASRSVWPPSAKGGEIWPPTWTTGRQQNEAEKL